MPGGSYRVHRYHDGVKRGNIILSIFKAIWWIISLPFRALAKAGKATSSSSQTVTLDRGFVQSKWQEIETLMRLGHPSNYARAVLEADKLLDHILKGYRAPGMTMGDRLKASRNRFSQEAYHAAWQAHKIRNEVVHNSTFELMDYSAKSAITNYQKAINELI